MTGQDQANESANGVDPERGPTLRERGAGEGPAPST